jgi:SAM-dependent methyltransferase
VCCSSISRCARPECEKASVLSARHAANDRVCEQRMGNDTETASTPRSPLSHVPPFKIRDLPREFLLDQLDQYYGSQPPDDAVECDYSLWECAETGLQFAWPVTPGNDRFYEWVSGFASYYPGNRWEYGEVRRLLFESDITVLDVGCGSGTFLHGLALIPNAGKFGVDTNERAIVRCGADGLQSYCGTVQSAFATNFIQPAQFQIVTSFHCLEHVDQPVEFVRSLMAAVAPGGRVFLSTPYSPMSFEAEWFDVLNHPPHHLTRWNIAAFRRVADLTGATMRHFVPPSKPLERAMQTFRLLHYGPHRSVGTTRLRKDVLRHLPKLLRDYRRQRLRQPVAADVILVEFRLP